MKVIRYSKGFKLELVKEVEEGKLCPREVERKYDVKGPGTVTRWVRQYGKGTHGKITRVELTGEVNEAKRLRSQLRQVKEALADAHVELGLEKAFLEVACEQLNQTLEGFKKKHAGGRRAKPSGTTRS